MNKMIELNSLCTFRVGIRINVITSFGIALYLLKILSNLLFEYLSAAQMFLRKIRKMKIVASSSTYS